MKLLLSAGIALMLLHTPAWAYFCSEPSAPYCATSYGPFNDGYDFEDCKRSLERYGSDVETYLDCLRQESDQAISDYNDAIDSFNRRARGY